MVTRFVEHRANAVWNKFLFSASETDFILHQLLEFFADEGLWGMWTLDSERWNSSGEEKEGRVREGEGVHKVWGGLI